MKQLEVLGPSGPRLLAGGPSILTSSFAPFGRFGRVTHIEKNPKLQKEKSGNIKSQVVRVIAKSFKQIQLIIFEKYKKRRKGLFFCVEDREAGRV